MQNGDGALTSVLPILGLLGVAGLRILPALQQVYHLLSLLRGGRPIFDLIVEELETLQKSAAANAVVGAGKDQILKLDTELSLEDVVYAYPETNRSVLAGLSLTIPVNTTVGIVGGTGAGKTTAIDVLLGLLFPQSGTIKVDDTPVERKTLRAWQNNVGYVPQQIFLVDATVAANIAFGVPEHEIDMDAVERAARLAELHDFVTGELENGYLEEVGERGIRLSGGQRQRIGIARALYHDPQVLILDEATSALDNLTERAVMDAVHNLGDSKTIIMIAHRLTTVQNCDQIFLLERGKLAAQGRYEELVETNATFREMARMVS